MIRHIYESAPNEIQNQRPPYLCNRRTNPKKNAQTHRLRPLLILHHLRIKNLHRLPITNNRRSEQIRIPKHAPLPHILMPHQETRVHKRGGGAAEGVAREPDVDGGGGGGGCLIFGGAWRAF